MSQPFKISSGGWGIRQYPKDAWRDCDTFGTENQMYFLLWQFVQLIKYEIDRYYQLKLFSLLILCRYYGIRKLLNGMSYFAQLSNLDFEVDEDNIESILGN